MNIRILAPAIAAGVLALTLSACGAGDTSVTFAEPQQNGITVTGQGSVTVAPDIAVINLGVEVSRPTVAEARDEAATLMAAMQEALTSNGVEQRDLATRFFNIYPQYSQARPCILEATSRSVAPPIMPLPAVDESASSGSGGSAVTTVTASAVAVAMPAAPPAGDEPIAISEPVECPPQEPQIVGFTVNNQLTVKVRDFDRLSETLDDAITAGGDGVRVNNVSFTVDEPERYWDEAREAAVIDARERAEQLATLAGASLGSVRSVSESTNRGSISSTRRRGPPRTTGSTARPRSTPASSRSRSRSTSSTTSTSTTSTSPRRTPRARRATAGAPHRDRWWRPGR